MKTLLLFVSLLAGAPLLCSAQAMASHEHAMAPQSTELKVTVGGNTGTLTLADLAGLSQKTVTVQNEHTKADETYAGVALSDILAKQGFAVGQATHRQMLRSYIKAEGTDKYWVLYSVTEIEPSEHSADVIVATSMNGKPLGDDGKLKLIDSADKKPQRWVRNLAAITLVAAE